ncbi:MAG: hypothetical protein EAS52_09660 [Parapedobacter sp.]|nr:MAG: hypothetical protein EAS52_09660 [Parapedobacter sp.]
MNRQHHPTHSSSNAGRMWAGIIIVGIGTVLLAGKLGLGWLFPPWIFNWGNLWPVILIAVGLMIGGNSNFRNPASYILLGLGSFFLLRNIAYFDIGPFLWPAIIIGIGLWLLLGKGRSGPHPPRRDRRRHRFRDRFDSGSDYEWDKRVVNEQPDSPAPGGAAAFNEPTAFSETEEPEGYTNFSTDDYLKSTSVFSDVKKTIISKHFQGGEVINIFGGTDINLIQADIQEPIVIDVFQIFAGIKIIVPSHWKIHSDVVSVFGEVDDKRFTHGIPHDEQKVVYIKGTSIFGGITIKSI